ncbi:MAG TPA: GAF domain-containing sensor histidine kinase [Thermodesulfobacteriota bacterium]|nr:GAF domain-containing sensor histidine kinase [Thermodesulfobacteriota bacterium]
MDHFIIDQKLLESITADLKRKGCVLSLGEMTGAVDMITEEVIYRYVDRLISQTETILEINPSLTEKEILEIVAKNVVEFIGAEAASIRIYDPGKEEMISFGSYPGQGEDREETIPFEHTIAGEVVKTHRAYFVPNILKEEKYKNKDKVQKHGIHSMLAIPISIPRFSLRDVDTEGALQIYYRDEDKTFTPLEVKIAEMLSRRVSYVIARKRIMDLQKLNLTKDKIVEQIFVKLGRREGIKMRDVFNLVIPELVDIMRIQRCSLFSVGEDRSHAVLEAGYPEIQHGIGKIFSVKDEPYIDAVVSQIGPFGEFENEKILPSYILIHNPRESHLLPPDLKRFLEIEQIHSVLYIPLKVNDVVNYFLVFDAQAHHRKFTDEEIEIFTFFGKELMKGLRLEKMDDILHDFKNPAIAVAGFAKRVQKILEDGEFPSKREKVAQALEIILKETSRIQELALTLHGEGREETVDLTEKLRKRFLINEEAMEELKRENVHMVEGDLESPLWIRCYPLHVERILDNLFNNASNAIPEGGGKLSIRSYRKDSWAVAEVTNTGEIRETDRDRYLLGEGRGRGLHITTRLVKQMRGKMEVESGEGKTTFRVMFPFVEQ